MADLGDGRVAEQTVVQEQGLAGPPMEDQRSAGEREGGGSL